MDVKVAGRFLLKKPLASKEGQVYLGLDTVTLQHVLVCVNGSQDPRVNEKWKYERDVLEKVGLHPGFINYVYSSFQDHSSVFVTSFPGDSLAKVCQRLSSGISLKTLYMIADQMLERLEFLQILGIVYGNLNPAAISIEKFEGTEMLRFIDFSSAKFYPQVKRSDGSKTRFTGILRYASIRGHQGQELAWKDDLECMSYTLVYLAKGRLPWIDAPGNTPKEKSAAVLQMKLTTSEEEICKGLPSVFTEFMTKVRNLDVNERPNYAEFRNMFKTAAKSQGIVMDGIFDLCETDKLPKLEKVLTCGPNSVLETGMPTQLTQSAVIARRSLTKGEAHHAGATKMDVNTLYGGQNPLLTRLKARNRAKRLSF